MDNLEKMVVAAYEREKQELAAIRNPSDRKAFMSAFRARQLRLKNAISMKKKFHNKYIEGVK